MKDKYLKLVRIIEEHNHKYYVLDKPSISDKEYDKLFKELLDIEESHPDIKIKNSPSEKVGGQISAGFKKVKHQHPMLSLDNTYSKEEILSFVDDIKSRYENADFVVEMKIDGLAMNLKYEGGEFKSAATRGDGKVGEDVSQNVKVIPSVPLNLKKDLDIELRGEVFMSHSSFIKNNERNKKLGKQLLANTRNAAAGTIRQLDSTIVAQRGLDGFWYNLVEPEKHGLKTHYEALNFMKDLGLKVNPYAKLCNTSEEVWSAIEEIEDLSKSVDFDIDGAVIKVNDISIQKDLGYTSRAPRFQKAYKYETTVVQTKVLDIFTTVGKTGRITPNAKVEPVEIDGTIVSMASLHNEDYVKDKDIRIGDYVNIRKAAEIIPEIVSPILDMRDDSVKPYNFPKNCPVCGSDLSREVDGQITYCLNTKCPKRIEGMILYFASRNAMYIQGMGEKLVSQLVENNIVSSFTDIYKLKDKKDEVLKLERVGEKGFNNLIDAIENSKENSLEKLLASFSINLSGRSFSYELAKHFKTMDAVMNASKEDLLKVNKSGEKVSESVYNYMRDKDNIEMINELKELGLNMNFISDEPEIEVENNPFEGMTVVITGSFDNFNRSELKKTLQSLGAKVTGAVSKNTDILVAGEKAGSKLTKAKELGKIIIDENELKRILN